MRLTLAEFLEMEARVNAGRKRPEKRGESTATESESTLHEQILAACDARLWGYVHSRMDRKTTTRKGVCDFVILADGGRVFFVECKKPKGKFTPEQFQFSAVAARNGHQVHRIETIAEFIKLVS